MAAFAFACMGVCVKVAARDFNAMEIVFYRGIVGAVIMLVWARTRGIVLATSVPGQHVYRSVVGVVALSAWFYAIAHLPFATAITLNYTSGMWIAAFLVGGALLIGKREQQGPLIATVVTGFVGVMMLLRPTFSENDAFAGLLGLLSGALAAVAYMQVMVLSRLGEPEVRTVFYFALGTIVAGFGGMLVMGTSPWKWSTTPWLLAIGALASLGQWCMTRAYASGSTLLVATLQYTGIVFSAILGIVLFDEVLPPIGWAGMALILLSGVAATLLRRQAVKDSIEESHG